ncbi:cocaine esterase-like [Physella acuta]|uniref:cocaine esterase-like n=1 Tax=Physella acuta TaxID=109671 RepID=UPI0027DCF9B8|nr:cocaine esterase-like [Physella acuta]
MDTDVKRTKFIKRVSFICLLLHWAVLLGDVTRADDQHVIVSTASGQVRGVVVDGGLEQRVNKFMGIPYGKSPTGPRRFAKPEAADSWQGVRDATAPSPQCPQIDPLDRSDGPPMDEDCLNLNVFVSVVSADGLPVVSADRLPVMVWIHGGSFYFGTGAKFDGAPLARKGVVVVTVNYRLDAMGFLSTEDDVIAGNFGLLDQILALHWVQRNIQYFGGDAGHVTVFGESAGGACVALLVLSPLASGLFHNAIVESGSSLAFWTLSYPANQPKAQDIARLVGDKVNCTQPDSDGFLVCMRGVEAGRIINASHDVRTNAGYDVMFIPRVETVYRVIPDLPLNLLLTGRLNHVHTIRGYNTHEAWYFLDNTTEETTREGFRQNLMGVLSPFNIPNILDLLNHYEDVYLGNTTDRKYIQRQLLAALSDTVFIVPTVQEILLESRASPNHQHYLYEFRYKKSVSALPDWVHAVHGDEVPFVFHAFGSHFFWPEGRGATQNDTDVSELMMALWTNFARFRDPTHNGTAVTWEPLTTSHLNLLRVDVPPMSTVYQDGGTRDLYSKLLRELMSVTPNTVVG